MKLETRYMWSLPLLNVDEETRCMWSLPLVNMNEETRFLSGLFL